MSTDQRSTELAGVPAEQQAREREVVNRVLASFAQGGDARLRDVMQALTRHLHAFLREVRLTEDEWRHAITFLTEAGHITDDKRQEFILLSDVLGASMQMITINNEAYANATEATVVGPFFVEGSPRIPLGGDIAAGAAGEPCWAEGTVTDTDGKPVPGARIEVWEADEEGFYDVQYADGRTAARAHLYAGDQGDYRFWGLTPTPYPIPHDGPVGSLLEAAGRSPMRASHLQLGRQAHPGDAYLRTRRRTAGPRRGVRRQGLPGAGLRASARRHAHSRRPRSREPCLVAGPLRHRPRAGRSVTLLLRGKWRRNPGPRQPDRP